MSAIVGPSLGSLANNALVIDARGSKSYQTTYIDSLSTDTNITLINGRRISDSLISGNAATGSVTINSQNISVAFLCKTETADAVGTILTVGQSSTNVSISPFTYQDFLEDADLEHGSTGMMQWGAGSIFTYQDNLENTSFNQASTVMMQWGSRATFIYQDNLENIPFNLVGTSLNPWTGTSIFTYQDNLENINTSGEVRAYPLTNNRLVITYNPLPKFIQILVSQGPVKIDTLVEYSTTITLFHVLWYTEVNNIVVDIYMNGLLVSTITTPTLRELRDVPGYISLFSDVDLANIRNEVKLGYLALYDRKLTNLDVYEDYIALRHMIY